MQYLSPNINKFSEKCSIYLQTLINLVKLLFCLFGKPSDLNTLRKCSVFKASFKKFQSLFFKISKLWNFFLNWGMGLNFGPKRNTVSARPSCRYGFLSARQEYDLYII